MDVTGQAFEDMQEQNIRLMQQLREKDDANFKLMSERIKSNQIHKLLKEEKEELADQLLTLRTQVGCDTTKHVNLYCHNEQIGKVDILLFSSNEKTFGAFLELLCSGPLLSLLLHIADLLNTNSLAVSMLNH